MLYRSIGAFLMLVLLASCGNASGGTTGPGNTATEVVPTTAAPTSSAATTIPTTPPEPTEALPTEAPASTAPVDASPYPGTEFPTKATDVPAESPYPAPDSTGEPVVAVWSRSGGFAGRNDTMTVYADGRVVISRNGTEETSTADPATVAALQQTFASPEWQALQGKYGEQFPDAFAYTVKAGNKVVMTFDSAERPALLEKVLEQLGTLFQANEQ